MDVGGTKSGSSRRRVAYDLVLAYSMCCSAQSRGEERVGGGSRSNAFSRGSDLRRRAHHWLVVKDHTFAAAHGGGCTGEVGEDDKGLALHLRTLEGDDIEDAAVSGEESKELCAELVLLDLVVQVVDVEGGVWLGGGHGGRIGREGRRRWRAEKGRLA